ncbi:MAG: hypothetical protein LBJ15_18895 [Comamonas sp.]|jgi:hypothetical protein|uniref:hypothetical protein n=1 Tax=Comamonas sp. TaxID=34028 RepID=UPI00282AF9BD|nr:hypothetical protein [Comamonas sp.]MDR0216043.1 hypothetical protein [Comamonas sp.]
MEHGNAQQQQRAFFVPTANPGYIGVRLEDKLGPHSSDMARRCSPAIISASSW